MERVPSFRASTRCAAFSACRCWELLVTPIPLRLASDSTDRSELHNSSRSSIRRAEESALPRRANSSKSAALTSEDVGDRAASPFITGEVYQEGRSSPNVAVAAVLPGCSYPEPLEGEGEPEDEDG